MPKAQESGYYAVRIGRAPGIYHSWADCEAQVRGFTGALYKKLDTEAEAVKWIAAKTAIARTPATRDIVPVASSSRAIVVAEPKIQPARSVPNDENDSDIVYCDGACRGNGQPGSVAGIGVWWGHGDPRNISERCPGDQTNNRAELIAIVRILETTPHLKRRLLIKTDSNYSIRCVTSWISKWTRNGFVTSDGKPVKNRALIKYLDALLHVRRQTSQEVEFRHVRGHVGLEGNEAADRLANLGVTKPMVPERDWESLKKKTLQALKPVKPVKLADDDLKAYADGLLDGDELAELTDTIVGSPTVFPQQTRPEPLQNARVTARSLTPLQTSPPLANVVAPITVPEVGSTVRHINKSSSGPPIRSIPAKRPAISKEEMEILASCLLDEDELAAIGKDGVFKSDF